MTFKVGDRVRTQDGEGQILSIQEGLFEVATPGENDWFFAEHELELVSVRGTREHTDEEWAEYARISSFEENVRRHTDKIASLLIAKNKQYSNSALDPIRVFSKSDRMEQLRVRADDKLSRIRNGDTSEDALTDLAGYIILMKIAEESE